MDQATIDAKRAKVREFNAARKAEQEAKLNEMLAPYMSQQPPKEVLEHVQFRHDPFYGETVAVLPPSKDNLFIEGTKLLNQEPTSVVFQLGAARVNAEDADQYNKRIGRIVSAAKMVQVTGEITSVHLNKEKSTFTVKFGDSFFEFMLTHGRVTPFLASVWSTSLVAPYHERVQAARTRHK